MKYNELIQFEPIETVVQLMDANKQDAARRLVSTYVVSDEMSARICDLLIPQLQFDQPADNKGILIVGNYGTGKSHLMSFLSAIAENADLKDEIKNEAVKSSAHLIAGKFKVIRAEIGSVTMSLRDIIIRKIEAYLEEIGVDYTFPAQDELDNHKSAFEDMMARFAEVYPDHGLLFVIDEMLDYLRSRDEHKIIMDLGFLREVGEVCKDLRFRFITGVQEAIFDSQRFAFVSDSLKRVKDRFEQILIARNDVKYVVSERLLKKSLEQQTKIREHLQPFAKYYSNLNERMDEFVRLYPIHPDYIDTFESIKLIEKREIIKTISNNMKAIIDDEVPSDQPGLLAFDNYWNIMKNNPSFRSIPEVKEVMDCSNILESRIENAISRKQYRPMAIRIIHALSIHRLTTGDIHSPMGATSTELRDRLCLFDPFISEMADDEFDVVLRTQVETVLREILKTVNSQFISYNEHNGQYYLDLKKSEDFDAIIEKKAESLSKIQLDRYYYEALKRAMECQDTTYVTGYKIWQHELPWQSHKTTRMGYLFFGAPNQRSTATPERDFYIYFIQPNDTPKFKDNKLADEVFFKLKPSADANDEFLSILRKYAASFDLSTSASGNAKATYISKADAYLKDLVKWLQAHMIDAFEVTYQGRSKPLSDWAKGQSIRERAGIASNQTINFHDLINAIAGVCLDPHFENQAPEYPVFSVLISEENRKKAAQDAMRFIAGQSTGKQATAVLDALKLLDGDKLTPHTSPYAQYILNIVRSKDSGQVVNRNEIIQYDHGAEYLAPDNFRLEAEWMVVLLAALVYTGDLLIAIPGTKFDSSRLSQLASHPLDELIGFKHLEQPKEWNLPAIAALFELMGLPSGHAQMVAQGKDEQIKLLQTKVSQFVKDLVMAMHIMQEGINFCDVDLLAQAEDSDLPQQLKAAKEFLENLQAYNTPGKLKNFTATVDQIIAHEAALKSVGLPQTLKDAASKHSELLNWLTMASSMLDSKHDWMIQLNQERARIQERLQATESTRLPAALDVSAKALQDLKRSFSDLYVKAHMKARLDARDDTRRNDILRNNRMQSLKRLAGIEIMPQEHLNDIEGKLNSLISCSQLTDMALNKSPICPHCRFNPLMDASVQAASLLLNDLDNQLDELTDSWTSTLLNNLDDPSVQDNLKLMSEEERALLNDFMQSKRLPDTLDSSFIKTLQTVLNGLEKVSLSLDSLQNVLKTQGGAMTPNDFKKCVESYLDELTQGKDVDKVRVVIE